MKIYDYAILGGGISGVSTAYWFTQLRPDNKVILFDRAELAAEATGRNAGFLTCGSINFFSHLSKRFGLEEALRIWRFCEENLRLVKDHFAQGTPEFEYAPNGSYSLFSSAESWQMAKAVGHTMAQLGLNVRPVEQYEINNSLRLNGFYQGFHFANDASVKSRDLVAAIARRCKAQWQLGTNVINIINHTDYVQVCTSQGDFFAHNVLVALNAFSARLFPELKNKIRPVRAQILETEPMPYFLRGNVYGCDDLAYFRQTHTGSILVGGKRTLDPANEETDSNDLNMRIQNSLDQFLRDHISLPFKVQRRWSGIMGFSPGELPEVGYLTSCRRAFYFGGYSGHGMGMGFHLAKCLVEWLGGSSLPQFLDKTGKSS